MSRLPVLLLRRWGLLVRLCLPIRLDPDVDFRIAFIVTGPKLDASWHWVVHKDGT